MFDEVKKMHGMFNVIFKIIGNNLPKTKTEGIYYILNEDSELITNGNYKYIM